MHTTLGVAFLLGVLGFTGLLILHLYLPLSPRSEPSSRRTVINIVPHHTQRYHTVGDWRHPPSSLLLITISALPDPRMEFLISLHEFIEANLCRFRNISPETVDLWDLRYTPLSGDPEEPGEHPLAPYHREHMFAERIERLAAEELGIDWAEYERTLSSLPPSS